MRFIAAFLSVFYIGFLNAEINSVSDEYEIAVENFNNGNIKKSELSLNKIIKTKEHLPARILLSKIYLKEEKPYKAIKHIEIAIEKNGDLSILIPLLSKSKLMIGNSENALDTLNSKAYEKKSIYYEVLGRIYLSQKKLEKAESAFKQGILLGTGDKTKLKIGMAEVKFNRNNFEESIKILKNLDDEHNLNTKGKVLLAESLQKNGNNRESLSIYNELFISKERNKQITYGYINSLIHNQKIIEAKKELLSLINDNKNDIYLSLLYATIISSNENEESKKQTERFITDLEYKLSMYNITSENERHIYKLKGLTFFLKKDFFSSKKYLKKYVEHSDKDRGEPEINFLLGSIYYNEKKYELAKIYARYAFERIPNDYRSKLLYANILNNIGMGENAIEILESSYNNQKDNQELLNNLMAILIANNQTKKAFELAPRKISNRLRPQIWLSLGFLYLETGDIQRAFNIASYLNKNFGLTPDTAQLSGEISLKSGNKENAISLFKKATTDKNFKAPLFSLAGIYLNDNEYDKSIKYLNKIIEIDENDSIALKIISDILIKTNESDKAVIHLEKLSKISPNNIEENTPLLEIYFSKNMINKAEKLLNKLLKISKVNENLLYYKARLNIIKNRKDKALESYNIIFGLNYNNFNGLLKLGHHLIFIKEIKETKKVLKRLKEIKNNDLQVIYLTAMHYRNEGKYSKSLELVNIVLDTFDYKKVKLFKANTLALANMNLQFLRYTEELYRSNSNDEDYLNLVLKGYSINNRNNKKIELLNNWISKNPNSIGYIAILGLEYEKSNIDKAIKLYKSTLEKYPIPEFYHRLNLIDSGGNIKYSKLALELEPENHIFLNSHGWNLIQIGDYKNGLSYIRKAIARDSNNNYFYNAAFALYKLNRINESKEMINQINLLKTNNKIKLKIEKLLNEINNTKVNNDKK